MVSSNTDPILKSNASVDVFVTTVFLGATTILMGAFTVGLLLLGV